MLSLTMQAKKIFVGLRCGVTARSLGACFLLILGTATQAQGPNTAAMGQAQKAFQSGNYADAAKIFYMILASSTGQVQSQSQVGLAKSLEKLGLRQSAAYFYLRIAVKGPRELFFREAMDSLARLNAAAPLGRASIDPLFKQGKGSSSIEPMSVPGSARGFYFFYKGLRDFEREKSKEAISAFNSVPSSSPYFSKARYYLGVMEVISGRNLMNGINSFDKSLRADPDPDFQEIVTLALARAYYEQKSIKRSLSYYSRIPRHSDLWLESLFEGAWAFFLIQKHNNTLGNIHTIHSPFFRMRFFPETYVLQAVTYLKLCEFGQVASSLSAFKNRYKSTFRDLNNLLSRYSHNPIGFFELIRRYRVSGRLGDFSAAAEVIDSVSRSEAYKEANSVLRQAKRERSRIMSRYGGLWRDFGLLDILVNVLETKIQATTQRAGTNLFSQAVESFNYLQDLNHQTKLIQVDMVSGETDKLRAAFNREELGTDSSFWGEGMKPLDLKAQLEYWPFEGEYWEDELGGYVYNMGSKCGKADNKKE